MQSGSFEVGDMVKFERGAYDHWGVYIGGGEIVHIGPEGTDEELNSLKLAFQGETKAAFKRDPLKRIAGNSCYYAHNYLDHKHTVRLRGGKPWEKSSWRFMSRDFEERRRKMQFSTKMFTIF